MLCLHTFRRRAPDWFGCVSRCSYWASHNTGYEMWLVGLAWPSQKYLDLDSHVASISVFKNMASCSFMIVGAVLGAHIAYLVKQVQLHWGLSVNYSVFPSSISAVFDVFVVMRAWVCVCVRVFTLSAFISDVRVASEFF